MARATKKQALGRGLSALLKEAPSATQPHRHKEGSAARNILELAIEAIAVNPFQPRTHFSDVSLRELAISIGELGIIQPITVRELANSRYQLISGERRLRASQLAGLKTIPAYVRTANDQESLEMALVENIQRQDLDPIEIALSYQRLIDDIHLTQEQMSDRVGKKRSTITNYLRLLKLDPIIQSGMRDGFIGMGHGRALMAIEAPHAQLDVYEKILSEGLSVRATEALIRRYHTSEKEKPSPKVQLPESIEASIGDLSAYFGHKIGVKMSKHGKGHLTIPFDSEDDFNRIKNLVQRAK